MKKSKHSESVKKKRKKVIHIRFTTHLKNKFMELFHNVYEALMIFTNIISHRNFS